MSNARAKPKPDPNSIDELRKMAQQQVRDDYDRRHPGEARMRKLVNERIGEPERSALLALADSATEFVWWKQPGGGWVRYPVVHKDTDVVVVVFGKQPIWLSAVVLGTQPGEGVAFSGLFGQLFYSEVAKRSQEKLDETFRSMQFNVQFTNYQFFQHIRDGRVHVGVDFAAKMSSLAVVPCFKALGLQNTATERDVRQAFGKLALKAHPDHGGNPEKFRELYQNYQAALKVARRTP